MKHNLISWAVTVVFYGLVWFLGAPPKDKQ
jgi:hypothetical protein